jgi:hypothetical protein
MLHVSGTHRCSTLVYLHLKSSIILQFWKNARGQSRRQATPQLWDQPSNTQQLYGIQLAKVRSRHWRTSKRRAARFVTNRTPGCVTNMITSLGWQSLEQRRQNSRLCILYKIQHNLIDIHRDLYIRHNDSRTKGQHRLFQERTNNETYRNSFFQRTVRDWNLLPTSTVAAATIEEFRANLMVSPASC